MLEQLVVRLVKRRTVTAVGEIELATGSIANKVGEILTLDPIGSRSFGQGLGVKLLAFFFLRLETDNLGMSLLNQLVKVISTFKHRPHIHNLDEGHIFTKDLANRKRHGFAP